MSTPENAADLSRDSWQPAEIPDKLYFRIGEVARLAGIKPYVLRFWETEFPAWAPESRAQATGCTAARTWRWCWRSSACSTSSGSPSKARASFWRLGQNRRRRVAKPASPRKTNPAKPVKTRRIYLRRFRRSMLDTVRKELREILRLLK